MFEIIAAGGVAVVGSGLAYLYYRGNNEEEEDTGVESEFDYTPPAEEDTEPVVDDVFDDEEVEEAGIDPEPVGDEEVPEPSGDDGEWTEEDVDEVLEDEADDEDVEITYDESEDEEDDEFQGDDESDEVRSVADDVNEQADPLPSYVADMDDVTDIKGIGPAKADVLFTSGYETPADVFYANDDDLAALETFGDYTVEQIREDIGYLPEGEDGTAVMV